MSVATVLEKENVVWQSENLGDELETLRCPHFVVLDIETTGYSPQKGGRIIEIAAVRVVNGEIVERFSTLVNPQLKIPERIERLTGITNEEVKDRPTIYHVLPAFYRFIGDAVIVAHNLEFDWGRFLVPYFYKVSIFPENRTLCTMKMFKKLVPGRGRSGYRLEDMCELLNVPLGNHHQAIHDAESTARCLIEWIRMFAPEALSEQERHIPEQVEIPHTPVKVKRVKYWEKRKNKREMYRRLYVNLTNGSAWGSVFFDIPTKTWGNKDFPLPLDLKKVEAAVVEFLQLESADELVHYRN